MEGSRSAARAACLAASSFTAAFSVSAARAWRSASARQFVQRRASPLLSCFRLKFSGDISHLQHAHVNTSLSLDCPALAPASLFFLAAACSLSANASASTHDLHLSGALGLDFLFSICFFENSSPSMRSRLQTEHDSVPAQPGAEDMTVPRLLARQEFPPEPPSPTPDSLISNFQIKPNPDQAHINPPLRRLLLLGFSLLFSPSWARSFSTPFFPSARTHRRFHKHHHHVARQWRRLRPAHHHLQP